MCLMDFVPFAHFEHQVDRFASNHGIKHFEQVLAVVPGVTFDVLRRVTGQNLNRRRVHSPRYAPRSSEKTALSWPFSDLIAELSCRYSGAVGHSLINLKNIFGFTEQGGKPPCVYGSFRIS
jgi:hypothetical protein